MKLWPLAQPKHMENNMTNNLPVTSITTSKSLATSNLTPEQKELCDTTCAEIRVIETSLMKVIFDIGERLIKVKNQLDHSQFSMWLGNPPIFNGVRL
jgi:hypothetical protein